MSHKPLLNINTQGSPFDCGLQYGQQTSELIKLSLDTYLQMFSVCEIDWPEACTRARAHLPGLQATMPHFVDELRGVAEGCDQEFDSLLALNCRTEILPADFLVRALAPANDSNKQDTHLNE